MKQIFGIKITILCIILWSALSSAAPQNCHFVSEGAVGAAWKKIRIQNVIGETLGGADGFSEAITLAQELIDNQTCRPQVQDCRLATEGLVGGVWVNHRIQMDNDMVFGADEISTALRQLSSLRRIGFCQ
ncbi:MAG: hypothetical protein IPM97_10280 [Bdellovibrionaceae bacterium]|nr:hypothetical protein [Pseudobdellovibrionaceae bacterium]